MTGGKSDEIAAADVFVSYSRDDEARARDLIAFLEEEGFSVWWDGMLEAGTLFTKSTETALDQAKAVVVLWSARSANSHWVRDEAQAGREDGRLVPVCIDDTMPPLGFRQFQAVNLADWTGNKTSPEIRSVRDAVARLVGEPSDGVEGAHRTIYRSMSGSTSRNGSFAKLMRWATAFVAIVGTVIGLVTYFSPAESDHSTIAILEFDNLSEDPEQAFFSNGLSEELRQVLSQNGQLQVIAPTSTNEAAKGAENLQAIGAALGVRYLLDGSVRRAGDTIRVSVQLVDNDSGFDIWSETYERDLDDIFAVQTDIATHVAQALELRVLDDEQGSFATRRGGTENATAYEAYLRGKALYDSALDEGTDRAAMRQFEAAVEADPNYGVAWAALARVQTVIANNYPSDRPLEEQYADAIASAERGIDVAPGLAAAHAALGFVYLNGRLDATSAADPFEQAYALGSGDADILQLYATFAARVGNFASAREAINRAIQLDPLNAVAQRSRANTLYAEGDYEGAREAVNAALQINPDIRVANRILGDIAYLQGDYAAARDFYEQEGSALGRLTGLAMAFDRLGDRDASAAAFADLREQYGDNSLYQQAQVLAQSGEGEDALDALEAAYAANDSGLVWLRNDPLMDPLRDEPRFRRIATRMGFD